MGEIGVPRKKGVANPSEPAPPPLPREVPVTKPARTEPAKPVKVPVGA